MDKKNNTCFLAYLQFTVSCLQEYGKLGKKFHIIKTFHIMERASYHGKKVPHNGKGSIW